MAGSTTVFLTVVKDNKDAVAEAAGVKITATGSTTLKGFTALTAGQVDVALSTDSLEGLIKAQAAAGTPVDPALYEEHFLRESKIVPVVHKHNPVKGLTVDQVRDIVTGKVKNWSELGGANFPIALFYEGPTSGNYALIDRFLLKGAPVSTARVTTVDNVRFIARRVGEIEAGFGLSPESYLTPEVTIASDFVITQRLCFIIRKDAPAEVKQVVAGFKAKL